MFTVAFLFQIVYGNILQGGKKKKAKPKEKQTHNIKKQTNKQEKILIG